MCIVSRRDILRGGFAALLGSLLPQRAWAASGNGTKLLLVNLNGGFDGLAMLQPSAGLLYSTLASYRPTLAQSPSSLLAANSTFGFHPNLSTFKSLYDEGRLAAVLNVGYDNMSRSHLDAEVVYSRGVPDRLSSTSSGFLTRLGGEYEWAPLQAVSVTGSDRTFEGGTYRGVQVNGLSSFRFNEDYTVTRSESEDRIDSMYSLVHDWQSDATKPNQGAITGAIELDVNAVDTVASAVQGTTFSSTYSNTRMGRGFKDIDIAFTSPLINAQVGYLRFGGFDTHSTQASLLNSLLSDLNSALATFVANMKAKGVWNNLIVLIYSEFGRTNRENGSQGTDHGGALPLFLTGGATQGGIVGDMVLTDLTSGGWLPMRFNVVSVYRSIFARMGYDPDRVFGTPSGASLPSLFSS